MITYPIRLWNVNDSRVYVLGLLDIAIPDIHPSKKSDKLDELLDNALMTVNDIKIRDLAQKVAYWRSKSGDDFHEVYEAELEYLCKRREAKLHPRTD
jgi:hypothetical protein